MKPARLRSSFTSSIFSRMFTAGLQFICATKFIHFLGNEAYGIVGIFLTLTLVSNVLDFGFSQSINREIARRVNDPVLREEIPSVLKSFETVYWLICAAVTLVLVAAAPFFVASLHAQVMTHHQLVVAMVLVGIAIGSQFSFTFYQGALTGFERQVEANTIIAIFSVPRILGTLLLVAYFSSSIYVYLGCQIAIGLVQSLTYACFTWRACGTHRSKGKFDAAHFVRIRGFLTGAGLASLLASLLMPADKIVVPAALPLALFGIYALGTSPVMAVNMISAAVSSTFFPRFSRLVAAEDEASVAKLYHSSSLITSVAMGAVTLTLIFFAHPFLLAWTGNPDTAAKMTRPLQLMTAALLFNGLTTLPYMVELAYGWTSLAVSLAAGALVILPPAMYFMTVRYGLIGAPMVWLAGNVSIFGLQGILMFRRILRGHQLRWLLRDTMAPIAAMALVAWGLKWMMPESVSRWVTGSELLAAIVSLSGFGMVIWAASEKKLRFNRK